MSGLYTSFYDNYVPPAKTGQYTVTMSQALTVDAAQTQKDGGSTAIDASPQPPASQTFILRAPRFVLDPSDVQSVHPPANGNGIWNDDLPMVVLGKRSLPWERDIQSDRPDLAQCPWLALLMFAEDELNQPDGTTPASNPLRLATMPLDQVVTSTFRGKPTTGPPAGTLGPVLTLDDDEDPNATRCTVIDVPAATFAAIAPALADLPYLAHVRLVTTDDKTPLDTTHDGWFSVVLANRFAIAPGGDGPSVRNVAHLVSLEGFAPALGSGAALALAGVQTVRLISLYAWSFTCQTAIQGNFRSLALNLVSQASEANTRLLLRMPLPDWVFPGKPHSPAAAIAFDRLQQGYAPLPYRTQSGESTFAWYRGPLAAAAATEIFQTAAASAGAENPKIPSNASEAMIFDATTGLFDLSYAVAFQTGRSLGLASLPFATSLLEWRRRAHALVDRLIECLRSPAIAAKLAQDGIIDSGGNLLPAGASDLAALLNADLVTNAFVDLAATEIANTIATNVGATGGATPTLASQQPPTSASPQPVVPADLAALMNDPVVVTLFGQVSDTSLMDLIVNWLARAALLYDVPFDNLVPSERMLPAESIRFFYLDANWIDSLLDGALSAGVQSSRDSLFHTLMRAPLHQMVDEALARVRDRLRGVDDADDGDGVNGGTAAPPAEPAGFLLRSALVANWPGLEIRAWSSADATTPMKPMRLDRVSPSVMLAIYPDVPVRIEINQPSEGIVFGREDDGIRLRYLPGVTGSTPMNLGCVIDPATRILTRDQIDALRRPNPAGSGALTIAGQGGLVEALQNHFPSPAPALMAASFAVQMVRVPEQMLFLPSEDDE